MAHVSDIGTATSPREPVRAGRSKTSRAAGARRQDPHVKSMLLGLIEESYLTAGTFTEFAAEVLEVLAYAVTVPVAFTEGFIKSYLSVERIVEEDDGRITVIPHRGADMDDVIRDADAILAQVDGSAVFNPVVQAKLDAAHQLSRAAMRWDLAELGVMDDAQLMDVLRAMQAASERGRLDTKEQREVSTDHIRARIARIRRNVRSFAPQGDLAADDPGMRG